jgi:hypothetical protein
MIGIKNIFEPHFVLTNYLIKQSKILCAMILQLDPSILVETPLGQGQAIFIIDYGMHQNSCWIVAINENGIVKHFDSNDVIISTNHTYHINMKKNRNHIESGKS